MRKLFLAALILTLPSSAAASCGKSKVCTPHAIRQDSYQEGRWWICNGDGTGETPNMGPTPKDKSIDV